MTCTHCSTWNFRDYKYCRHCGTRLDSTPSVSGIPAADHQEDPQVERYLQQAFTALDHGDQDEALAAVQSALALQPGSPSAHSVLGALYERQGQASEAILQFELALQLNPDSAADREKLAALAPGTHGSPSRFQITPMQIALATAVVSCLAVLATGITLMVTASQKPQNVGGLEPASGTARMAQNPTLPPTYHPASRPPAPAASSYAPYTGAARPSSVSPAPLGPGTHPAPNAMATVPPRLNAPVAPVRASQPNRATEPRLTGSIAPTRAEGASGLAPARIGQIVPLPQKPDAAAPAADPSTGAPASGPGAVSAAVTPRIGAARGGTGVAPPEPSEPETGFIRIEPLGAPQGGSRPATGPGTTRSTRPGPPSISISVLPGQEGAAPAPAKPGGK